MSFKSILTYFPSLDTAKPMLEIANRIASDNSAHLVGLHIVPVLPIYLPVYGAGQIPIPEEVVDKQRQTLEKEAAEIKSAFDQADHNVDVQPEWRCNSANYGEFAESIIDHGKCADLVIISRKSKDPYNTGTDLPARVVMETGRPTLLIPTEISSNEVGKNVLIAWNGTREAARAAFDALPLMKNANTVRILSVNPQPSNGPSNFSQGDELAVALSRHDIEAEIVTVNTRERSAGEEIISRVSEYGNDLLVMGCYGHSRVREMFFGGATSDILDEMPIPVLMAH